MNGWMVSQGLDVSIDEPIVEGFAVRHGVIAGKLLSVQQSANYHKIVYTTTDISNCFKCLNEKPKDLSISYGGSFYTIVLEAYNYKLDTSGNNLIVTIEEINEETK